MLFRSNFRLGIATSKVPEGPFKPEPECIPGSFSIDPCAFPDDDGKVYIYYASSDTRMHVAETDLERLKDYVFNTPEDPLRSPDCVRQRAELIRKNLMRMNNV